MTETPRRGAFHPRGTLASALGRGPIPTSEDSVDASKMADAAAAAVDDRALVSLLQEMVRIRSYSAGGEEGTIARFMQSRLSALGLEVELQEVQPGRFHCNAGP